MTLWQSFKRLMDPSPTTLNQTFSLGDRGEQPVVEQRSAERLADAQTSAEGVISHIDNLLNAVPEGTKALEEAGDLAASLDQNIERLKTLFRMPANKDLIIREVQIASQPPTRAVVCFMEGLSDKMVINTHILQPLMLLSHLDHHVDGKGEAGETTFTIDTVLQRMLPGNQVTKKYLMDDAAEVLLAGDTVIFFEGARIALDVDTKAPPVRSVGRPQNERTIQGSQDAFVEAWRVNVALVRRRLKDPRVITEILSVGTISRNYIGLMYIDGIASPKLVAEVKRRIDAIKVDIVNDTGVLEQYIEDSPAAFLPGALTTERPDRTAAYLSEGHVAAFVDTSPYALICPVTFWSLLQTAEDYYLRAPYGTMLRYIRMGALLITLMMPSLYIALVNYHHEMIPTELMLFIASAREQVPMPAVAELLLMDTIFELIREAGTRIPSVVGPTIGLVASLILGQAAVEARIVSPVLILIVAVSGLASFAIPNYLIGFGVRLLRFALLLGAATLGFYGLGAGLFVMVLYLAGMRSFGVPYLSPVAPFRGNARDVLHRPPMFQMEKRPTYTHPLDNRRQREVVRKWDPITRTADKGDEPGKGDNS
ncbi:MAG: spore germination protein [Firmicutes bacterium]|nr:spore germination protein [Bacillota bacterium]